MAGQIRVNTDQVAQIASEIEKINKELRSLLADSKAAIETLKATWEGEAADTTSTAYNTFEQKYFDEYEELINQYVKFLRTNVDQGYTETETQNVGLAESFS